MTTESVLREAPIPAVIADCAIERQVAASRHAIVYLARWRGVDVALKVARGTSDPLAPARLAREAAALARVVHPSVSPLLDAGTWVDGSPYVITPWIAGTLLEDALASPMRWRDITPLLIDVARGLCALHDAGVVHRDLKPTNVIAPHGGVPSAIILDLGHASLLGDPRITQSGSAVGSLPYMAPEQVRGATLDGRADLYALGVILYRALTGSLPYRATQVLRGELELAPLRKRAPKADIPPEAEDLCRWLLAAKAADRLPSAHVLAVTLAAVTKSETR